MKIKLLPTLLLVVSQTFVFSQTTGDYRSTTSGLWISTSSWEYYNGSSWVTPSGIAPQGYPGQFSGTGTVLIQSGHTISINQPVSGSVAITTQLMGTVTVTGTLSLLNSTSGIIDYNLKTENIIVTSPNGRILLDSKINLTMPVDNAVLQVSGLGINNGVCNNTQSFIVGLLPSQTLANCEGNLKFSYVSADGGTSNAKPTSNSPVCEGSPVKLYGDYSGLGADKIVVYSWTVRDNNNNIVNQNGSSRNPIINGILPGTYKATLKCSVQYDNNTVVSNSETINVVVNPTPTVPVIGAVKPIDCNSAGSVVLSGLPSGTWTINPGNIVGSGSSKTVPGLAVGNSHSFTVTNQYGCVSPATVVGGVVITDKSSSTWNGSWSNEIPGITTNVIIAADYDTTSLPNITACSLTVNSGKVLTISNQKFVTVQNNLVVNGTLNIANQGSLVMISDSGTVTNNGTMKVNKTTTPFEKSDYTYWSSPITSTPISYTAGTTFANWRTDHAYYFNPANFLDSDDDGFDDDHDDWVKATNMDVPGKGYIIMGPTWLTSYPATESVVFNATSTVNKVNTGSINVPIQLTPGTITDDDWNLVGNPYPCAIDANKFINANIANIDGTLYFWTHKANLGGGANLGPDAFNYSQSDYAIYNLTGGTATVSTSAAKTDSTTGSSDSAVNSVPLGYIASCQGFFVEAKNGNVNLLFNNDMRVGSTATTSNTQFFRTMPVKEISEVKDRIWLNLENKDGMFSQQLVGYFKNATNDFDNGYDGMLNDGGNYVNFYSLIGDRPYKIQGREAYKSNDEVHLGYSSAVEGIFNINIDSREGVFSSNDNAVFLEDKLTGNIHNLNESPYSFTTKSGTYDDRFVLRYADKTLETKSFKKLENTVLVYNTDDEITVNSSIEMIDKIQVYDLSGRVLFQKTNINNNEFIVQNLGLAHQVLLVKILLHDGRIVADKIVY